MTTITESEIEELGFVKDILLTTDTIVKFDYKIERKDLHPLYTYTVYTLYWDLIDGVFDLIGQTSQNNMRVYFTNHYHGNFATQERLKQQLSSFLRKDLKGSPLIKNLIRY